MADLTFYFGAASGSSRKALRQLEEPNVMINYATKNNEPWDGLSRLFIDSGGYSFMKGRGEYQTTDAEYVAWLREREDVITQAALRDYPCESDVLEEHGRTVRDHQRRTTARHINCWEEWEQQSVDVDKVSVIQGWTEADYLRHIDDLRAHGVLADTVGIGSVCRRNRDAELRRIILSVREALPSRYDLHAFGVKQNVLQYPDVVDALASADSQAYEMQAQWGHLSRHDAGGKTFRDSALEYLKMKRRINAHLDQEQSATEQTRLTAVADGGPAKRQNSEDTL
jgi:hypothetical protein